MQIFSYRLCSKTKLAHKMVQKNITIGPWGDKQGEPWSFIPNGKITKIIIRHGDIIDSISFTTVDDDGNVHESPQFGGSGGDYSEVNIDINKEELTCISGAFRGVWNRWSPVSSLSFSTNLNKYGPIGSNDEHSFSLPVTKASFAGFHGYAGGFLHAIGVYLKPT